VFLPVLLFEVGVGATVPVIALTALDMGASTALAGLILTLLGVGQIAGNMPSSLLVNRLGDRRAMMVAAIVATAALVGCSLAPGLREFAAAVTLIGLCNATFYLGRQHYVIVVIPPTMRAVALSTLGGSHRIGLFLGPFAAAAVIDRYGLPAAYLVAAVAATAAAVSLVAIPNLPAANPGADQDVDPTRQARRDGTAARSAGSPLRTVAAGHVRLFLTLGMAVFAVGAARSARHAVIPLWAAQIGLSATTISVIFGVAAAFDMALFYPAGRIMDQYGRLAVAVPSMVILGTAMALLPLTHTATALALAAIVMSIGNGLGSGIIMTLGADAAPPEARVGFLSIWRTISDTGSATGPLVVAALAAAWTLAAGIVAAGLVGLLAALALQHWVPRYSAFANRRMVQAARARRDM
jgi:MFS family permease